MLAFYMDHHVNAAIRDGLRRRGIEVITAFQDGSSEEEDAVVLARATHLGLVLVTHDDDFLRIARQWRDEEREFVGIVFAIQQFATIGKMIEYLELIAHLKSPEEMRNSIEYVPTA